MTLKGVSGLVLSLGVIVAATSVSAHHSFAATFDINRPITVQAVVSVVKWENPHTLIYVDVKDSSGRLAKWVFESFPPGVLFRKGLKRDRLKPGAQVTLKGHLAKDGSNFAEVSEVIFPDGLSFCVPASGSSTICEGSGQYR